MHTRRLKFLATGLGVMAALYFGVCWQVLKILITPERRLGDIPTTETLGVETIDSLSFKSLTDETSLQGWFVPNSPERVIIVLHGLHSYAWNCGSTDLAKTYAKAGFSVFLFDQRGHGQSGGEHLGLGLLEKGDVQAAVNLLLKKGFHPGDIGIHGSSYGAAVTLLATEDIAEIGAIVADSAFASMNDVVSGELKRQTGLPPVVSQLLMPGLSLVGEIQYGVDITQSTPEQSIGQISPRPILLIHGEQDLVIPYEHAQRLQKAAGNNVELWTLPTKHVEGIRLADNCGLAPMRNNFLAKVSQFFDTHLVTSDSAKAPVLHQP
ncbi:MAG: alpha/beta fold hydrolase [Cyanobacteria bacterium J06642_11]